MSSLQAKSLDEFLAHGKHLMICDYYYVHGAQAVNPAPKQTTLES